jgi:hypothetical protein
LKKTVLLVSVLMCTCLYAQASRPRWQRGQAVERDLTLFHSTHLINLPTAETLQKSDIEFEVSHRFIPPITEGSEAFFGIDGPVNMRLSLAYGLSDRMMLTLGRSNVTDNLDLSWRYKFLQNKNGYLPLLVSIAAGIAHNSQVTGTLSDNGKKYQFFGHVSVNSLLWKKLGIAVVPSYLHNSYIYCDDSQYSFTLGSAVQFYASPHWSILAEWNPTVTGWRRFHNTVAVALELETGGHFFKILFTNNDKLNPAHHLTGADLDFAKGDWRLGFMITRLIKI